jgi:hypothetical protein
MAHFGALTLFQGLRSLENSVTINYDELLTRAGRPLNRLVFKLRVNK